MRNLYCASVDDRNDCKPSDGMLGLRAIFSGAFADISSAL